MDKVVARALEVFSEYEFILEKRLTVVKLADVTFRKTFAEAEKMLLVVRALVKIAFPSTYKEGVETTTEFVVTEIVFIFVLNTF
jgi:hypothetical protein